MTKLAICYFASLMAVSYMLMAWFKSGLPIHVFHMARRLGYKHGEKGRQFWESIPEWESTWDDWATAVTLHVNPFAGELLTCPVCLSAHMSFWTALAVWYAASLPLWALPVLAVSLPAPANIIFKKL